MKEKMMELVGNTLFVNMLRSGDRVDYGKLNPLYLDFVLLFAETI